MTDMRVSVPHAELDHGRFEVQPSIQHCYRRPPLLGCRKAEKEVNDFLEALCVEAEVVS